MKDPLLNIYEKYSTSPFLVKEIVWGARYCCIMLHNGQIGVCATLDNTSNIKADALQSPDFNILSHRILLNAYYNAVINEPKRIYFYGDIFQVVNFKKYSNIVMIGFFRPLVKKFMKADISLSIFDRLDKDGPVLPDELQPAYIQKADALILTATSIFNNTFLDIVNLTNKNCDVFVVGPSALVSEVFFQYKNVKAIFGSLFKPFDTDVLKIIAEGYGTRMFAMRADKIFIKRSDFTF
ncbi:MAG TPA: DUF364 domain-containing protein [Bacteroidales bacterium]|nr:DUF364 domain-containing protein [Bacteroidales bacterium]